MDPKTKRTTLRLLTNGMYILTARSGEDFGASTVTWVSQASFKPPLIMAAVRQDSNVLRCMKQTRVAALHILDRNQKAIAQRFFSATKHDGGSLNGEVYSNGKTSAPILHSLRAYVECKVVEHPRGIRRPRHCRPRGH